MSLLAVDLLKAVRAAQGPLGTTLRLCERGMCRARQQGEAEAQTILQMPEELAVVSSLAPGQEAQDRRGGERGQ